MLLMLKIVFWSVSRNALHDAYNLLKADDGGVSFQHFILFMEEYQPERGTYNFSLMRVSFRLECYIPSLFTVISVILEVNHCGF